MITLNECENNPKEMWKAVTKLTNKSSKTTVISEIHQGNHVITNKSEIANALNTYFSEVGRKLQSWTKKVAKTSLLLQNIILRHVCPIDAPSRNINVLPSYLASNTPINIDIRGRGVKFDEFSYFLPICQ